MAVIDRELFSRTPNGTEPAEAPSSADGSKKHDDSADGFFGDWAKRGDVLAGYVSREALAQQFGISERTLSRWETIRTGPPATHVGRDVMYRVASVQAWLAAREQKPPRRAGRG